jgi:hypothetical protein
MQITPSIGLSAHAETRAALARLPGLPHLAAFAAPGGSPPIRRLLAWLARGTK